MNLLFKNANDVRIKSVGWIVMFQSFLLVTALCLDSFVASLSYGASRIKIPFYSAVIISSVGTIFLAASLFFAKFISGFLSLQACKIISVTILCFMGITSLFNNMIKQKLKNNQGKKHLKFKYSGIDFVISLYLDETVCDLDHSKILTAKEALLLALALSIDSLVTGFSVGLGITNPLETILLCFSLGITVVLLGCFIGRKIVGKKEVNLSWLSGIVLILLAALRIV